MEGGATSMVTAGLVLNLHCTHLLVPDASRVVWSVCQRRCHLALLCRAGVDHSSSRHAGMLVMMGEGARSHRCRSPRSPRNWVWLGCVMMPSHFMYTREMRHLMFHSDQLALRSQRRSTGLVQIQARGMGDVEANRPAVAAVVEMCQTRKTALQM